LPAATEFLNRVRRSHRVVRPIRTIRNGDVGCHELRRKPREPPEVQAV